MEPVLCPVCSEPIANYSSETEKVEVTRGPDLRPGGHPGDPFRRFAPGAVSTTFSPCGHVMDGPFVFVPDE